MKKKLLLLLVVVCIGSSALPAFAEMKYEPDGFRDIRWGTPVPKNNIFGFNKQGFVFNPLSSTSHNSTLVYNRKKENLMLGGASLTEIEYMFIDVLGFCRVMIYFQGDKNFELIRKACLDSWGKPTREVFNPKFKVTNIVWRGEKVLISFSFDHDDPTSERQGHLWISLLTYFDAREEAYERYKQRERGL